MTPARTERPETIYNTLMGYVRRMEGYTGDGANAAIRPDDIASLTLALAIPARTGDSQMQQVLRAVQDAASQGVRISVTVVR